jgi:ABC-type protease/lipase transport system fused ATPase/permease subunit
MNDTRAPAQGPFIDYLPNYRQEIITPITRNITAGESCSIVGVASTGKSNLFRFLIRPGVCQRYLEAS